MLRESAASRDCTSPNLALSHAIHVLRYNLILTCERSNQYCPHPPNLSLLHHIIYLAYWLRQEWPNPAPACEQRAKSSKPTTVGPPDLFLVHPPPTPLPAAVAAKVKADAVVKRQASNRHRSLTTVNSTTIPALTAQTQSPPSSPPSHTLVRTRRTRSQRWTRS